VERITRAAAVLGIRLPGLSSRLVRYILIVALAGTILPSSPAIAAGSLTDASVSLSDPIPTDTSSYTFAGSSVDTATAILCVKVVWSTTATGDTAPAGFDGTSGTVDAANSTLIGSSATNWSLARSDGTSSSGQDNIYEYTNSAAGYTPSSSPRTFVLAGLTNPSTPDTTYYFQIKTYGNTNCSSSPIDYATVQFINTDGSLYSLDIDPTLTFTVGAVAASQSCGGTTTSHLSTATTLDFGNVATGGQGLVCQDLQASTNATNGYTIYTRDTGPFENALSQSLADVSGSNLSPSSFPSSGTEAYGYTTDDQSLSATGDGANRFYDGATYNWAAMTQTNAEVGYESSGVVQTTYRIGHRVGLSSTTAPGTYTTTIIYTCTPVY
jgi:hypothetical protein